MQGNQRTGTTPELRLRSALHATGLRFRVDYRIQTDAGRVRPDIAFTRRKVAVFVDGCFWHGCPEHGVRPKSNTSYWDPKLRRNAERDRHNSSMLQDAGWTVVRIWEHVPTDEAVRLVADALASPAADSPFPSPETTLDGAGSCGAL
jgi:DNA mismatch endonuclease (patch repair protein)